MSHTALGRVAIRLLHDVAFVDAVYADPTAALAGIDLTAEERAWIVAVPRSAWRTDADRPRRVLGALADEFPASWGLAPERAERFFRSPQFHAAVQDRGSLALAFGAHMAGDPDVRVTAVARIETATAAVRRAPGRIRPSTPGWLRLTPAARVIRAPAGGAALLAAIRGAGPRPELLDGHETLLVVRRPHSMEVTIEPLSGALADLLARADVPARRADLVDRVRALGADDADAPAIVADLVGDAILV